MTPLAIVFMLTAVTSVTVLLAWCFYRVFTHERRARAANTERDGQG